MMDGVSTMDTGNNGQLLQMNPEAIAEVKVLTAGYQAEYGRSSGLQITAVTKSGTNRFHGSRLRRHAQLRLELEQLGQQDQRHAEGGRQAVGLGLHVRRAGRASPAATTSCSSSTRTSTGRATPRTCCVSSACRRRPNGTATSRRRSTTTARPIPAPARRASARGMFAGNQDSRRTGSTRRASTS